MAAVPPHSLSTDSIRKETAAERSSDERAEIVENLRAFFTILREWDEEDRQDVGRTAHSRQKRAAKTIAEHFTEDVESR